MVDSYRSVLQADSVSSVDLQQWLAKAYPADASSLLHAKAEIQNVDAERWTAAWGDGRDRLDVSFISGDRNLVVLERQWPADIRDDKNCWPPTHLLDMLAETNSRIGPFSSYVDVEPDSIVDWLDDPDALDAQLVLAVAAGVEQFSRVRQNMQAELLGLAAFGCVDLQLAERIQAHGPTRVNQVRDGCLMHVSRSKGATEVEVLPATVVKMQPDQAVQRVKRRCARRLAEYAFTDFENRALLELGRQQLRGSVSVDADQLLEDLLESEEQVRRLRDERELSILEHDETLAELNDLKSRARWLELRLRDVGEYTIPAIEDDVVAPDSCGDAERLARELLQNLAVGDIGRGIAQLDEYEKSVIWAKKIWMALRALDDYASAKTEGRHAGNFLSYCTDPPTAALPYSAQSVAMRESDSTESNPATRLARTFPVPVTLNDAGKQYMGAHLKIDAKGSPAPRIHFFDDTVPTGTGFIYIGYVGPHLPTAG